jgi:DNA-binding transcriptional LysR family regulator
VDLDLAQVRAFVCVAEHGHFGRAATALFLTQQALSKRIQRLERALGATLLARGPGGVRLTEAGRSFLPYATTLLADADVAIAAANPGTRPLRIDTWSMVLAPLRVVRRITESNPELVVETSMRRNFPAALQALRDGEIDVAFGRVPDLGQPWPAGIARRPVIHEPCGIFLGTGSVQADARVLGLHELCGSVWFPAGGSSPEAVGWYRRFAEEFGVAYDGSGQNLGLDGYFAHLRTHPKVFSVFPLAWATLVGAEVRVVPAEPAPIYRWWLAWRADDTHPRLQLLLDRAQAIGQAEGWLAVEPGRHWLPSADLEVDNR